MKEINIRKIKNIDLKIRYVHIRDDKSLRPYVIDKHSLKLTNKKAEEILLNKIKEIENIDDEVELKIIPEPKHKYIDKLVDTGCFIDMCTARIPDEFSHLIPDNIWKSLNKKKVRDLCSTEDLLIGKNHFIDRFIVIPITNLLARGKSNILDVRFPRIYHFLQKLGKNKYERILNYVAMTSINCYESDIPLAIAKLGLELDKLDRLKLIKGSLAHPLLVPLVETIGINEARYGIVVYYLIDCKYKDMVDVLDEFSTLESGESKTIPYSNMPKILEAEVI